MLRDLQGFLHFTDALLSWKWLLLLIPAAGWFFAPAALLKQAWDFVVATVKKFIEGLSIALANPAVFLIIAGAFIGGLWQGIEWDKHKVDAARTKLNTELSRIETSVNERVSEGVREALRAKGMVSDTPDDLTERKKLCKASASCRSRGLL